MGKFSADGMKKFQKQLSQVKEAERNAFLEGCAKELAARLLAKVIKRTPVGDYSKEIEIVAKRTSKNHKKGDTYTKRVNPSGKVGGTLRRGWISKTEEEAAANAGTAPGGEEVKEFTNRLAVNHNGKKISVEIVNPVEHAVYVEYGHRTVDHKNWIPGNFMLTMSEKEIREIAPNVLEARLKKYLEGILK